MNQITPSTSDLPSEVPFPQNPTGVPITTRPTQAWTQNFSSSTGIPLPKVPQGVTVTRTAKPVAVSNITTFMFASEQPEKPGNVSRVMAVARHAPLQVGVKPEKLPEYLQTKTDVSTGTQVSDRILTSGLLGDVLSGHLYESEQLKELGIPVPGKYHMMTGAISQSTFHALMADALTGIHVHNNITHYQIAGCAKSLQHLGNEVGKIEEITTRLAKEYREFKTERRESKLSRDERMIKLTECINTLLQRLNSYHLHRNKKENAITHLLRNNHNEFNNQIKGVLETLQIGRAHV